MTQKEELRETVRHFVGRRLRNQDGIEFINIPVSDLTNQLEALLQQAELKGYHRGLLYNKQVHRDFSDLGAGVSIQAEIRRTNARLKTLTTTKEVGDE